MNKSSRFHIFYSATSEDFFDDPVYVIAFKECNICPCTHTIHLLIFLSSWRLEHQMNGVQREEVQLAIWNSKDQYIRGYCIYEKHVPWFFFWSSNNKVHRQYQRKCKQWVKYCWRKPSKFEDRPPHTVESLAAVVPSMLSNDPASMSQDKLGLPSRWHPTLHLEWLICTSAQSHLKSPNLKWICVASPRDCYMNHSLDLLFFRCFLFIHYLAAINMLKMIDGWINEWMNQLINQLNEI